MKEYGTLGNIASASLADCCTHYFRLMLGVVKLQLNESIPCTCRSARDAAYKKVFVCFENAVVVVCAMCVLVCVYCMYGSMHDV